MTTIGNNAEASASFLEEAVLLKVRGGLKKLLMEAAEKEINSIVDKEMETLKFDVEAYYQTDMRRTMVEVLVTKKGFE